MIATMTSKGQVTLPKSIREQLGLQVGDKLDFIVRDDGSMEVVPIKQPVSKLKGILPKPAKPVSIRQMNVAVGRAASGR